MFFNDVMTKQETGKEERPEMSVNIQPEEGPSEKSITKTLTARIIILAPGLSAEFFLTPAAVKKIVRFIFEQVEKERTNEKTLS